MSFRSLTFILLIYNSSAYYWRDYHLGNIPEDALSVGKDLNDEDVYVGQAFVSNNGRQGVMPTSIRKGKDVYAQLHGVVKANSFIQILCADANEVYEWLITNPTDLHLIDNYDKLVWGGVEDEKWLAIGWVNYQGSPAIGKVLAGQVGKAYFHFVHNEKAIMANSFGVLVHHKEKRIDL